MRLPRLPLVLALVLASAAVAQPKADPLARFGNRAWWTGQSTGDTAVIASSRLDLFAEPPDGYFLETKREPDGSFRLTLAEAPRDAGVPKTPVRFTMPTGAAALEFSLRLDAGRASP